MARRPQILFLDAYDSFTNNIVSLLTTTLGADVFVLPIDTPLLQHTKFGVSEHGSELARELSHYDAVVCGPGPGSPEVRGDVGLMSRIWALGERHVLPVLGICLGFQSLLASCGARIRRLRGGLHGMVRAIEHCGLKELADECERTVFSGVGPFKATLYHSLCVDVGQDDVSEADWPARMWAAFPAVPEVLPLAWTYEEREDGVERILMAAKHRSRPYWGLQYHPESVCTDPESAKVIENWFGEALRWNHARGRMVIDDHGTMLASRATRPSLLSSFRARRRAQGRPPAALFTEKQSYLSTIGLDGQYHIQALPLPPAMTVPDVAESLGCRDGETIILDSANADRAASRVDDVRGRYSIIAVGVERMLRLEYRAGDVFAVARIAAGAPGNRFLASGRRTEKIPFDGSGYGSIWELLSAFAARRRIYVPAGGGGPDLPFRGGFMGYVTYELGLHDIGVVLPRDRGHERPDLCFVWVTDSVVIDHVEETLYVQTLGRGVTDAKEWVRKTVARLQCSSQWRRACSKEAMLDAEVGFDQDRLARWERKILVSGIKMPNPQMYEDKVRECQEAIAAGESYELCLTAQTDISRRRRSSSLPRSRLSLLIQPTKLDWPDSCQRPLAAWELYRTLRKRQPAPFSSYLRLGGATLIRSSPERFLDFQSDGTCSMKPMKGTVRKSDQVVTLAQAEAILHVPKEEAENLMIVDLVRHDLHAVCGPGNVVVDELLKVEEYTSVFQMVTVVSGRLPAALKKSTGDGSEKGNYDDSNDDERYTGLDLLAASLPPGSMTGAPKKRSCEILRRLEGGRERSLYSGVVGYMCATGRGDWSVTIRSMFRWDDELEIGEGGVPRDVWHVGAGGAVTTLSTPVGERDEMLTKLAGPLGVFGE